MRIIAALLGLFLLAGMPASAQAPEPPAQVRELLKLLGEPAVRSWLDAELKKAPPNAQGAAESSFSRFAAERLALTRARLNRLGAAVSQLPQELRDAGAVLGGELQNRSPLDILVLVLGFGLLGAGAEWAFRRATHAARLRAEHAPFDTVAHRLRATAVRFGFGLAAVLVFAAGSIGAFLMLDWPPVLKAIVLAYLIAALASRVALLVSRLLLEPRLGADDVARYRLVPMPEQTASFWHLRIGAFAAWFAFGWASCDALAALGFSDDVQSLVAFTLGLGLLLIAIEALWRRPRLSAAASSQTGHRRREALDWLLTVYLVLMVVIFLVADLLWQVLKTLIDRRLAAAQGAADLDDEAAAREARLRTLLPTFRNFAFVALAVVAVMMALSAVGIEIGPLIAGAGVLGVAIGFGSQTLVRDVIGGVFYLLDDAFRVGEYIQSGNYRGTVESFSLRSVKLRHHRGPVYTVPFGQLGAVQNMSRDWVIDKMTIGVSYDTDIDKARKIVKQIGKELAADPEFAPHVIEPLKMQGVEQFGDYAIQLRLKMMTKPNEQFVMRRRALAMIKKAFDENGIRFAFPTVQVGGGDAAAAAAAVPVLAAGKAPAAEAKA